MNKSQVINYINHEVSRRIQRKLTNDEIRKLVSDLDSFKCNMFPEYIVNLIINDTFTEIKNSTKKPESVDIKEYLKTAIDDDISVNGSIRKAYFLLDRKYQSRIHNKENKFTWALSYLQSSNKNSVVTKAPMKNIRSVHMYPFRFPETPNAMTFARRISVSIEELGSHGFTSVYKNNQFQFLFDAVVETEDNGVDNIKLLDSRDPTDHTFYANVQYLESITLTFGNPINKLILHTDRLIGTITSVGIQTVIEFTEPHLLTVGDVVSVENFSTTNPVKDSTQINLINGENGLVISSLTDKTITLDVNLSGIVGVIDKTYEVYFESRRFMIPIEFSYESVV